MKKGWRQFRPVRPRHSEGSVFSLVHAELERVLASFSSRRRIEVEQIERAVERQIHRVQLAPNDPVQLCVLLVLRAPAAVRAQQLMDEHPHNHQRGKLFELIDFNDSFVSTAIAMSSAEQEVFIERLRPELDWFCKQVGIGRFTDEQYEAITRGLTREVAVYLGAKENGFEVIMTDRRQDAMGVDMVVTDPVSGRSLNIDCKTPSAYRYRIEDLLQQGRMNEFDVELADQRGYTHETNGHGSEAVQVVLFRVDQNEVGDIVGMRFSEPHLLGSQLQRLFSEK